MFSGLIRFFEATLLELIIKILYEITRNIYALIFTECFRDYLAGIPIIRSYFIINERVDYFEQHSLHVFI